MAAKAALETDSHECPRISAEITAACDEARLELTSSGG
jgi:hypothetical protein